MEVRNCQIIRRIATTTAGRRDHYWSDMALRLEATQLGDNGKLFRLFHKTTITRSVRNMVRDSNGMPIKNDLIR